MTAPFAPTVAQRDDGLSTVCWLRSGAPCGVRLGRIEALEPTPIWAVGSARRAADDLVTSCAAGGQVAGS